MNKGNIAHIYCRSYKMPSSFASAPLVELIADLRWRTAHATNMPEANQVQTFLVGTGAVEPLAPYFDKFSRGIAAQFPATERLVPVGYPLLTNQPVLRFRPAPTEQQSSLYQIGPGIFTANAVPPYKSWAEFVPVIEQGVQTLLDSRIESEKDQPFSYIGLRYIDAFDDSLTGGRPVGEFIGEILGLKVQLPEVLAKYTSAGSQPKPALQLHIPMDGGMVMNVSVGEGTVSGRLVVIMDTTVATTTPVPAGIHPVMDTLATAHEVIHDVFFGLTEKISVAMQPVEV